MQGPPQGSPGNRLLNAEDFQWGEIVEGIQLGLWCSQQQTEVGKYTDLRAAVRNLSGAPSEIGNEYGLIIQREGDEVFEDFGGPKSTTPVLLEPREFRELFVCLLTEPFTLRAGSYQCWAVYRPKGGREITSKVITVEVGN